MERRNKMEYQTCKIQEATTGKVLVWAWIEKVRDQKSMQFVILKDRSGKMQMTIEKATKPELAEIISHITPDSYIQVKGTVVPNEYVKLGQRELIPDEIIVESLAEISPIDSESSIDQRLDYRWIDLRDPKKRLIFETQTVLNQGMRDYCIQNGFIEVHCPTTVGNESESGAGVFEVKYFDRKAYLIQSPQFFKQMAIAAGFEKVFICTPIYRAEKSFTRKHATEFSGFDLEFANVNDVEDVMKVEEALIHAGIQAVAEKLGARIQEELGVEIVVPTLPFPRITMKEAYAILDKECDYPLDEGSDFDTEAENLLSAYMYRKNGHQFFFVKDYPAEVRPFYSMHKTDDPTYTETYDLYFKDVEITSGAKREHRADILAQQIADKGIDPKTMEANYINFFKYGCPPHGGFGIGMDRLTMLLLDVPTIKEAMFVFRGPDRLNP